MARLVVSLSFLFVSAIHAQPVRINVAESVEIGGIKQWLVIKSADASKPVLLFLHGGPGNSAMGYADRFTDQLQKNFVIVLWDQRESGKTLQLNHTNKMLTVELMESDAVELIQYLKSRFSKEKIYLMGHSWGGFLGILIAWHHPELLNAYLAVSPMINQLESERLSLQWMMDKAAKENMTKASEELAMVRIPFENGLQLYYHRSWLYKMSGQKFPSQRYVETWAKTWLPLWTEAAAYNFMVQAPEISCPIYFFAGRKDYQTHFQLTETYYKAVKADKKQLYWFEDSGHNLILTEPKKFQDIVIQEIVAKSSH